MDRLRHAVVVALVAVPAVAGADHDHSSHHPDRSPGAAGRAPSRSRMAANVGLIAAVYDSTLFEGDYQGATFGGAWTRGRFEVGANGAAYRIDRNGKTDHGFGDLLVHANVAVLQHGAWVAGAHVMVMVPTGDEMYGLGMGHFMVMPALWSAWSSPSGSISTAIGYTRGIGDGSVHAEHGGGAAWPLVEPMNFSEVTFDAGAMLALAPGLGVGPRAFGALPTGGDGRRRLAGAARVAWREGRVDTSAELQVGIAGDPFELRGVLASSVRF